MQGVRLAGVIGDPVAHSKSPLIHNTWLKRYDAPGLYAAYRVPSDRLRAFFEIAPLLGFAGFNVTIPHKEAAAALCDELTATAERCGSVNTVTFTEDGRALGDSTDGFGFLENLTSAEPNWRAPGAVVAILGAGGAVRSVVEALTAAGVAKLRIANRTVAKAESLVSLAPERTEICAWPPDEAFYAGADLIVNGTSLGMSGGEGEVDWGMPSELTGVLATDLIYAPLQTPFLTAAARRGARTVDGLGMLLHQARPGFQRWFGPAPEVDAALRQAILHTKGWLP